MKRALVPWLLLIVPLLAGPPVPAAADSATHRDEMLKARREKLHAKWEAQFRAADADADRLLSLAECVAGKLPDSLVGRFVEMDTNADGGLSPEELLAVYDKRLDAQRPAAPQAQESGP